MRNRKWFLTINNYSDQEWWEACAEIHECTYGICCKEVGELETPHLHLWLHYDSARSDKSIQKKFPRCWKAGGKGRDQDQKYLKKMGEFVEHGVMEEPGRRTDIHKVKEIIKDGGGVVDIIKEVNSYQAIRCGELILKYMETPREIKPIEVIWFWGIPKSGKTRRVFDTEVDPYRPTSFKWWEGYDAHEVVLLDDWRPEWCSFVNMLKLTDIYPFRVECKGGSRQVKYKKIYITSDHSPREYYEHLDDEEYRQLERRITSCVCFDTEVKG